MVAEQLLKVSVPKLASGCCGLVNAFSTIHSAEASSERVVVVSLKETLWPVVLSVITNANVLVVLVLLVNEMDAVMESPALTATPGEGIGLRL